MRRGDRSAAGAPVADARSLLTLAHGSGPSDPVASRARSGLVSARPLRFMVTAPHDGVTTPALLRATISESPVRITPHTELRFAIFPDYRGGARFDATHTAVDVVFDDGTRLSDHDLADQFGFQVDAQDPGYARSLTVDQWNFRRVDLSPLAGRTAIRLECVVSAEGDGGRDRSMPPMSGWLDAVDMAHSPPTPEQRSPADYVVTTRGTHSSARSSRGNTIPAVAVPHGFNVITPVTDARTDRWIYRYHQDDVAPGRSQLQAFAISHLASPWMRDRGVLQIFPAATPGVPDLDPATRSLSFSHGDEIARAHYYRVDFDGGIRAELAPTDHAAVMTFTFPGDDRSILIDQPAGHGGLTFGTTADGRATFSGYVDETGAIETGRTRMFFVAETDAVAMETGALGSPDDAAGRGYIRFAKGTSAAVQLAVATSFIGIEQASRSLHQEIAATDTGATVAARARTRWDDLLGRVTVHGASEDRLVTLYSCLYRVFLFPSSASENVGTVGSPDLRHADFYATTAPQASATRTRLPVRRGPLSVNNGFWDTYRTAWPALCLLEPERAGSLLDGVLAHFRAGGWTPRWSAPGYADCMVGTSADIVLADATVSDVGGFDREEAYDCALRNATTVSDDPATGRKGLGDAIFAGFTSTAVPEGLSWTLEGAINDYGIHRMSRVLADGEPEHPRHCEFVANAEYFFRRAGNFESLFDPSSGFFRGRGPDGAFRDGRDFDPDRWGHDYTETNAWGMAFSVPHDGAGLAALHGGAAGLEARLDAFFDTPETAAEDLKGSYPVVIHEMTEARDIRRGMLGLSNQPAHHIPYMYLFTASPHKTQEITRDAVSRLFTGSEIGQGYPGDEDNGEMSAWWIFSALGLYPLTPASGGFVVTSPLFDRASIRLAGGAELTMVAHGQSPENVYIQSLSIDGRQWSSTFVPLRTIIGGARLDFVMGPLPSRWASAAADRPPSLSPNGVLPQPLRDLTEPGSGRATSSHGEAEHAFDDVSTTGVVLPAGGWVRYDLAAPVELGLYTVTTSASASGAAPSWVLESSPDGSTWQAVDSRAGVRFRWRRQTRAFRPATPRTARSIRIRAGSGWELLQLELFAARPPHHDDPPADHDDRSPHRTEERS